MARPLAQGERPLDWVGSSKRDLLVFPEPVKDEIGNALGLAQFGDKHPKAKPWKGQGPGIFEIVEDYHGDTYRAVYTVPLSRGGLRAPCIPEEVAKGRKDCSTGY